MARAYRTLTAVDVETILRLHGEGMKPLAIAERYGVSDQTIYKVIHGRHDIQVKAKARAEALAKPKPCPGCGRPLFPPCKICATRTAAAKAKTVREEAAAKNRR